MFDGILDKVSGTALKFDPRKVIDLIDDLWESRHKIVETVDFVWDNRDAINSAIGFMGDHADDLVDLGKRLPALLFNAGSALGTAGDGARQASQMLLGSDGDGVRELAGEAADALERCQSELWMVMGLFDRAGSGLAALPLVGEIANPLVDGAGRIGAVSDDLGSVARRLRGLGASITDAGRDLGAVGDSLGSSGAALQLLTAGPVSAASLSFVATTSSPRARPTKKATAKKAPAKKGSVRKATAKKAPAKKGSVKKAPAKMAPAKKGSVKKAPAKKAPAKKGSVKKAPAKMAPAKKGSVKKAPGKKSPAKKSPAKS